MAALALLHSTADPQVPPPAPQSPAQQVDPTTLADVVVRGAAAEPEQLRSFVTEIGGGPPRRLMARWNRPICIGTVNARPEYAQPFIDHMARVAIDAGAAVDGPGCRANMLVIFTSNGKVTAEALAAGSPLSFIPPGQAGPRLTRADLDAFINSDRPVRWWHLSQDVSESTGNPVQMVTIYTADGEEVEVPQVVVDRMSRLGSGMRTDLQQGVIIVDTSRLGDTSTASLADYAAMVMLSQIDPGTQAAGFPSILSLFSRPVGSASLTEWDMAYLRSLYRTPPGRPSRRFQEREIAAGMEREFTRDPARPVGR
ncbi:hypothetical protein [Brevundimonas kwangchunensis]|uniref:hypothetical protein n=1 Tax=Brevundimonas kwangchunensis TaxID=322163 RepID=UPI0031CED18D